MVLQEVEGGEAEQEEEPEEDLEEDLEPDQAEEAEDASKLFRISVSISASKQAKTMKKRPIEQHHQAHHKRARQQEVRVKRVVSTEDVVARLPPTLKLSYATDLHKKVVASGAAGWWMVVPKGPKAFAWFTYDLATDDPVCYVIQLQRSNSVQEVSIVNACFDAELSAGHGTMLFGTSLANGVFHVEDVIEHRGQLVAHRKWPDKVAMLTKLFQRELRSVPEMPMLQRFCCATICADPRTLMQHMHAISLPLYSVQFLSPHKQQQLLEDFWQQQEEEQWQLREYPSARTTNVVQQQHQHQQCLPPKPKEPFVAHGKVRMWRVKADAQNDIYHLYDVETGEYGGVALVPDYVTSVQLNALFRTIKENVRLDALEESDGEEEFEDIREDKFVLPGVEQVLRCSYHGKFKKWVPLVKSEAQPLVKREAQPPLKALPTTTKNLITAQSKKRRNNLNH